MEYLDFEVAIEAGGGGVYRVAVLRSPAGQTQETTRFPFDQAELQARLAALGATLLRARGTRDVVPVPGDADSGQRAAREFGGVLFETLFAGDVRNLFVQSLREAGRQSGRGLRVRLRTQVPELAALPWEFVYDHRPGSFVCLSSTTPFVRFLEVQQPADPIVVGARLNILGMIASPAGLPALDVAREKARVEEAIAEPRRRGLVDLVWLEGQTWRALKDAIAPGSRPWHVFHFIGHGGVRAAGDGYLALASDQGGRYDLTASGLSDLLANHQTFRLAVLNACESARSSGDDLFSGTAATLVRRGLPAVVSMQREISDQAAIEFAREFYRTLAQGGPVDAAVAEARVAMSLALPQSVEWATPTLHMRSPDGVLFRVQPPKPPGVVERAKTWWASRTRATRRALVALPVVVGVLAGARAFWRNPPAQAFRIAFYQDTATVLPGKVAALQVWALDSGGNRIAPATGLAWSSSDTSVATVLGQGSEAAVTARAPGFARIRAAGAGSMTAEARITVQVPVASIEVRPQKADLASGATLQLNATLRDAKGGFIADRPVRWRSSNDTVATVSAKGLVAGYAAGTATMTAMTEERVGQALIRVTEAATPPVQQNAAATLPACVTETIKRFNDPIVALAASYNRDDNFRIVLVATVKGVVYEMFYHAEAGHAAQAASNPNPIWTDPSGSGIVAIAGFYSDDDAYRHLIVATKDGKVREYFYNPNKPHGETIIGSYPGIVGIAGFYNADDHNRVVLVATQDGKVREVYYQPSPPPGRPPRGESVIADYGPGNILRIAGTFVQYTQDRRLVTVTRNGSVQQVLYNPARGIHPEPVYGGADVVQAAITDGLLLAGTRGGGLLRIAGVYPPRPLCASGAGQPAMDNLAMDYFDEGNLVYSTNDGSVHRFIAAGAPAL